MEYNDLKYLIFEINKISPNIIPFQISSGSIDVNNLKTIFNGAFTKGRFDNNICKIDKGDVRNKKLIKKLIKSNEFIVPLVALVGAPLCEKKKREAVSVNLESIKYLMKIIYKKKPN